MAKITENIVLFSKKNPTVQVFADKVKNEDANDKTRKVILKDAAGNVYNLADCERPDITTIDGLTRFLTGFGNLPCAPRSGYDSFVNGEGPTNPKSPTKFSAAGTFRIVTVYLQALYMKVAEGGQQGEDAQKYLALLPEYSKVAAESAATALSQIKQQAVAVKAKELDVDPDELAAFIAARKAAKAAAGGKVAAIPATTVTADADETGEAGDADEETLEVDAEESGTGEPEAEIAEAV
jgi:hypothetical protein